MTKKKLLWCSLILLVLGIVPSFAQTAEIMDGIITTPAISVSQAAYLVFVASGKLAEDSNPEQAYALFEELNWVDSHGNPDRPLSSSEYAYLLSRSFGLKGGLFYSLFPGPRYAFRDLVFKGILASRGDPDEVVSGVEAVRLLGKVMDGLPTGGRT